MIDDIKRQLHHFFPGQSFPAPAVEESLADGTLLVEREQILPFLQTALFDEKVLEVEFDGLPEVYFSRLKDDLPDHSEEDEATTPEEIGYQEGDYLTAMSHLVTLPIEPGLGNLHLRNSRFIVLRMFTNTYAVELGTVFEALTKVGELPVLKLSYPKLARIVRNAREFRAKVPETLGFVVDVEIDEEFPELTTTAVDIGLRGMAFSATKQEQKLFRPGAVHALKLYLNDELVAALNGTIRHLSRIRKRVGIEYVCGVEFELTSRTLAAVIESVVASVQRAHLKELAEKSDASGIHLIA
jgi:hypothetical protein